MIARKNGHVTLRIPGYARTSAETLGTDKDKLDFDRPLPIYFTIFLMRQSMSKGIPAPDECSPIDTQKLALPAVRSVGADSASVLSRSGDFVSR
jgi:hypothetical protein